MRLKVLQLRELPNPTKKANMRMPRHFTKVVDAATGKPLEGVLEATLAITGEGSRLILTLHDFDIEIRNLKPGEGFPDDNNGG